VKPGSGTADRCPERFHSGDLGWGCLDLDALETQIVNVRAGCEQGDAST